MKLIEHHAVDVESVLAVGFCGENLVEAVGRQIYDPLGRSQDLYPLLQSGTHTDHVRCNLENDGSLLPVSGTSVDLRALLMIATAQQERNSGCQLAFSVLLGNFNVCHFYFARSFKA